ncbi:MAG: hypothetical protein QNK18_11300 [Gammaproteobacteria bacterium]|nr:hypothetical protein [Gammaproteobacteria bacterium]MDJ0891760.1 hypothetical protein [Gammaproteobacteria bacterium]
MNKMLVTLGAGTMLVLAGAVSAEERLSFAQMDAVTAGGNAAASALADAFGVDTFANTSTATNVASFEVVLPQLGEVNRILSTAVAASDAGADASALANSGASGVAEGDLLADTSSDTTALVDSNGSNPASTTGLPMAMSTASNATLASTLLRGFNATSSSAATSAASLQN